MKAFFNLYKRKIKSKEFTEEEIIHLVNNAYSKLAYLTDEEYNTLIELIDETYSEE